MAIEFNSNALSQFRNVNFNDDNAIANLDGKGLKANGKLGNFIGKMFRATKTENRNNAVREELLRSLGQAFGLSGLMKAEGNRVAFSPEFMQKLEKLLGSDILKTGDFKIDRNGPAPSATPPHRSRGRFATTRRRFPHRGKPARNRFPLCGKVPETCFHCVEVFPKHASIVWKNHGNRFPLCGNFFSAPGGTRRSRRGVRPSFFFPSAAHPVDWHRFRAGFSRPFTQTETPQPNDFDDITSS